jgi:hypothetical protein
VISSITAPCRFIPTLTLGGFFPGDWWGEAAMKIRAGFRKVNYAALVKDKYAGAGLGSYSQEIT